jgi:hypothetical protein
MELDEYIEDIRDRLQPLTGLHSDCPIPSLLLACRESFSVASKVYTRSFSSLGALPQIYFNFQLDTLHIDHRSYCEYFCDDIFEGILDYFCLDELAKIENFSLHESILCYDQEEYLCQILSLLGNVQNLFVVQEHLRLDLYEPGMSEIDREADLKFFEVEEVCRRSYMFQHPEHHLKHLPERLLPRRSLFNRVVDEYFDYERTAEIANTGRSFPRPSIQSKILASATLKANYEAHKRQYESLGGCRCYESEIVKYSDAEFYG